MNPSDLFSNRAVKKPLSFAFVATFLLIFCVLPGFSETSFSETNDKNFINRYLPAQSYMPVSEIKEGMTGYGLTVFQGAKIERFDVQVIDVVKKVLHGRDAILVKLSGPAMGKNNVIRGMSGSPVYINGKLVGAVSFGYDFSTEPIVGVTPIADMLDALAERSSEKIPLAKANDQSIDIPWNESGLSHTSSGSLKMVPLVSPVALAGFSPRAESFLTARFKDLGMLATAGAAGAMNPALASAQSSQIKPGASVSIILCDGDFTIAATGTATARFGDKVLAFGHPFLSAGSVEFPMATARVHKVICSLASSFKMASPVAEVGAFTNDRPWSCGGQIGSKPKMIPAYYTIVDETRNIERSFQCMVVDHPELTPQILSATAMSAIDATHQNSGPYIAKMESSLQADGIKSIVRTDRFASNMAQHSALEALMSFMMGDSISSSIFRNASSIANNEFQKSSIKSFKIKVTLEDGHKTAAIDRVYLEKAYAAPGEEVKVLSVLKPYNKEAKTEVLTFRIPRDTPDGNLLIGIAGGDQIDYVRNRMNITDPEPESLTQIAARIQKQGRGDELNLVVALPEQSLLINGITISDPPSHWSKVLFSNRHTKGPKIVKGELRQSMLTDYMLNGSHIITIEVRSHDRATAKSAPAPMQSGAGSEEPAMTELARKTLGSTFTSKESTIKPVYGNIVIQNVVPATTTPGVSSAQSTPISPVAATTKPGSTLLFAQPGKGYPHMRLQQLWQQESEEEFRTGKCEGVTVDSWGRISPGLDNSHTQSLNPESNIWSGCYSNGFSYFSTANKIWRWNGTDSSPELVCQLDTAIIPALAADTDGTLYAASVPEGKVYSIDKTGQAKVVLDTAEPVVTCLVFDQNSNLFVGVAGNGKVYKLDKSGSSTMIFDSGQAHITALHYSKHDGNLYIGTGERGAVYSLDAKGQAKALYQSPDHLVTGVAKTKSGDIFVSTSASGHLARILPSGEAETIATSEAFYTLHYDEKNDLVFSGDAEGDITMACLEPITKQPYFTPVCHTEQEAVMALSSNGQQLFAGSSNLSTLKAFNILAAKAPYYESKVKDAGRLANWSRLRTFGPFTEMGRNISGYVKVESRTGETSNVDSTWSAWSQAAYDKDSYVLSSPQGRYLQYRLKWVGTISDAASKQLVGPQIGRIEIVFLPKDLAPQFSSISVKPASTANGKVDLSITGSDADGDNMLLSIMLSADDEKTWEELANNLRPKNAKKDSEEKPVSESKSSKQEPTKEPIKEPIKSPAKATEPEQKPAVPPSAPARTQDPAQTPEHGAIKSLKKIGEHSFLFRKKQIFLDDQTNPPSEDKPKESKNEDHKTEDSKTDDSKTNESATAGADKTKAAADASAKPVVAPPPAGALSETFTWVWDTTKLKDGFYVLKFILDDRLSNPEDHLPMVNIRAVAVDNTPPEITLIQCRRNDRNTVECHIAAQDKITPIANALYRIDEGEYSALAATPESNDGLTVNLLASGIPCSPHARKIEVKVSDRAGNTVTKSFPIK